MKKEKQILRSNILIFRKKVRPEKPLKIRVFQPLKKNKKNLKKVLTFRVYSYIILFASNESAKTKVLTGCGSAWLERLVWDQEVAGSNPVTPMMRV